MTLSPDYTLKQVAAALGMSERWIRQQVADGAEHIRYGNRIRFTSEQVEKLRAPNVRQAEPPIAQSITTGRRKRAS